MNRNFKYFLADSPEEAEDIFTQFKGVLNGISYTFSVSTGVEKRELFAEAIFALEAALKNYNANCGASFKTYATDVIKKQLSEYVNKIAYSVNVPKYIKQANININKLRDILLSTGLSYGEVETIIDNMDTSSLNEELCCRCDPIFNSLLNAASRASIHYGELINRGKYIPVDIDFNENVESQIEVSEDSMHLKAIVEKLKEHMTETELIIANGIMEDKDYTDIAQELGMSCAAVSLKMAKMREKLTKRLKSGKIKI